MDKLADALLENLNKENDTPSIIQKQFTEVRKNIDNMLNAVQQGIFTPSTKERKIKKRIIGAYKGLHLLWQGFFFLPIDKHR